MPSRSPRAPSPLPAALERLAKASGAGAAPSRMAREIDRITDEWRAEPGLDSAAFRERLEELRGELAGGVAQAEDAAGDVDNSDKSAARRATATLDGLRAAHDAVVAALRA